MTAYLCDTNVWFALSVGGHGHETVAREWFDALDDDDRVYFCRSTQQSLMRLITSASLLAPYSARPLTNEAAWRAYDAFFADSRIGFRPEPLGLDRWWRQYSQRNSASPKLWMDAYLAAFARVEGCTMVTTDAAFRQFSGLDLLVLGSSA